jgi:hypothetical protein
MVDFDNICKLDLEILDKIDTSIDIEIQEIDFTIFDNIQIDTNIEIML